MRNHPYGLMLTIHKIGKFGHGGSYYQPPNNKAPPATANSRLTAIHPLRCARTERTGHGQTSARYTDGLLMVASCCMWLRQFAASCCCFMLFFSLRCAFPSSTWNTPVASTWHLYAPKETTWCLSTWLNYCLITLKCQFWIAKSLLSPH